MSRLSCVPALLFVCILLISTSAVSSELALLGRWEAGTCHAVAVDETHAYYGDGMLMKIVDMAKPGTPSVVGQVQVPAFVQGICVQGDFAYIAASGAGLQVIDVSDPANPRLVGSAPTNNSVSAVTVVANKVYVVGAYAGMRIYDVLDPAHPKYVGGYYPGGFTQDVAVRDDVAYLVGWHGVWVLDVRQSASPVLEHFIPEGSYGAGDGVVLAGDVAYIVDNGVGLVTYDITDMTAPVLLGQQSVAGYALDVKVQGDLAVVACRGSGLRLMDVSDPADVTLISSYDAPYATYGIALRDDLVYMANYARGMRVVDIQNEAAPQQVALCSVSGFCAGLAVRDQIVYSADSYNGLRTYDVSNPESPVPMGFSYSGERMEDLAITGDRAYAGTIGGLDVYDISDPAAPTRLSSVPLVEPPTTLSAQGAYLVSGNYDHGVTIFDVSDPDEALIYGTLDVIHPVEVVVCDGFTCVATAGNGLTGGGLTLFDHTVPGTPSILGTFSMQKTRSLAVCDDRAYVSCSTTTYGSGIMILDIADPAVPQFLGFLNNAGSTHKMTVSAGYLYYSPVMESRIEVVDVRDPSAPTRVFSFDRGAGGIYSLVAQDALLFCNSLAVLHNTFLGSTDVGPTRPLLDLHQNFPNPFNPATVIAYTLPANAVVDLRIYDLAGRLVRTLEAGQVRKAGRHRITWRGQDQSGRPVPSGMYVYRLDAGGYTQTCRMTLVR